MPSPDGVRSIDHTLAADLAGRAGELLIDLRTSAGRTILTGKELGAQGDRRSHDLLVSALHDAVPGDAILSEEGKADPERLTAERVWIIDPLDGTREFGEPGRVDWAVHVALVIDGEPVAGAVALPALGQTLATHPTPPELPLMPINLRMVVSRTRAPSIATDVAEALGADVFPMGSAGAKAMAIVLGDAEIYLHAGGQYEWDSAAPVAVARAAGLHCSRIDGGPLRYNMPDPYLPDLLICRPEIAGRVLDLLHDLEP